ncbi:MAG: hypothetical protein ACTHL3_02510 [Candidatus Nitrosocosmicus sp.]
MVEAEKVRGSILIAISLTGFLLYTYILFGTEFGIMLMKLTALTIIGIIFFIIGWIGFTLTTGREKK